MNKASGCNRIPAELFKPLKYDDIKVFHSICQQIWKAQQWSQKWKRSVLTPVPKKGCTKECSNDQISVLISQPCKVMLKNLHARPQHYMNQKLLDVQPRFRKDNGTRDLIVNMCWVIDRRQWQPTSVLMPGKSHGWRSLVDCSPWGR